MHALKRSQSRYTKRKDINQSHLLVFELVGIGIDCRCKSWTLMRKADNGEGLLGEMWVAGVTFMSMDGWPISLGLCPRS